MRKTTRAVLAVGFAAGIVLATAIPANASQYESQGRDCANWSWTSANSSLSTTHKHSIPGYWEQVVRSAGQGTYKGIYNDNVFMEIQTAGSFSSWAIGCAS